MWIKLLGASLILVSAAAMGWLKASRYIKRLELLKELQVVVALLDAEISYKQTPVPEALLQVGRSNLPEKLKTALEGIAHEMESRTRREFYPLWQQVLKKEEIFDFLTADDRRILEQWGYGMGRTGLSEQQNINQFTSKKLKEAEKQAAEIVENRVKLTRYAGVLLGLLVVILLY